MFELGLIPQIWQEGMTILLFKGGKNDPSDAEAYRGITVMASVLKMLVATVLDRRFKKGLDQFFRLEQAGFRGAEECSGHVVAFYEVVTARKAKGLKTFACLIDIKNAYDTVPINAFIAKLELAGVNGKTLRLIRELYRTAQQKLHTHLGLSEFIRQLRGLRQGDPSSPIIFNVFINDIFDRIEQEVEAAGVLVEGLRERLLGLLFADDLVIWAETPDKLQKMMNEITAWGNANHMSFGIGKCGVMGFGTGAQDQIKNINFQLQTKRVPVVSSYKYLGVIITTEFDMEQMVQNRIKLGLSRLNSIRPTLRAQWLPIYFRVKIIKTMLIPVLTWGAELWGLYPTLSEKLQSILNKAINIIYGFKDDNVAWINKRQAMVELGIPPIYATAAAAVARGRGKFQHSKTVVRLLMKRTTPHVATWTAQADLMLKDVVKKLNRGKVEASQVKVPVSDTRGRNIYEFALNLYWQLYNKQKKGAIFLRYAEFNLSNTNHIVRNMIQSCPNSTDFRWLLAARGGLLHTVNQLTRFRIIHENIDFVINRNDMCPWCSANVREDPSHIVLHCERFQQFRGPLQPVLDDMVWEVARLKPVTGDIVAVKDQTQFQNQQIYPRPEATKAIIFHVAIGGTWVDNREIHARDQNGEQLTLFWVMRCRNFVSKTSGVASHYIAVQKVLSNMYQFRNSLLDQHFTVQEQSMRTCWLFYFYHSEPTPIGRARTTEDEEVSSLEGASVVGLDPE
jgi:Reverse transcriptase (RNA-dependent DNA polymerase)